MPKILLVDDDALVRDSLAIALEGAGYEVVTAANGDEGLEALGHQAFDAVILDMLMPEREGIETIREIRKSNQTLPVLAISAATRPAGPISCAWRRFSAPATHWPNPSRQANS